MTNNNFMTKYDFAKLNNLKDSTAYKQLENALKIAEEREPNIIWSKKIGKGGSATKYYNNKLLEYISGTNVERISKAYSKIQKENKRLVTENQKLEAELMFAKTRISELEEVQENLIESINKITTQLVTKNNKYKNKIEELTDQNLRYLFNMGDMFELMSEFVPEHVIQERAAKNFEQNSFTEKEPADKFDVQGRIKEQEQSEEFEEEAYDRMREITTMPIDKKTMAELIDKYSVNTKNPDPDKKLKTTLFEIEQLLEDNQKFDNKSEQTKKEFEQIEQKIKG